MSQLKAMTQMSKVTASAIATLQSSLKTWRNPYKRKSRLSQNLKCRISLKKKLWLRNWASRLSARKSNQELIKTLAIRHLERSELIQTNQKVVDKLSLSSTFWQLLLTRTLQTTSRRILSQNHRWPLVMIPLRNPTNLRTRNLTQVTSLQNDTI